MELDSKIINAICEKSKILLFTHKYINFSYRLSVICFHFKIILLFIMYIFIYHKCIFCNLLPTTAKLLKHNIQLIFINITLVLSIKL